MFLLFAYTPIDKVIFHLLNHEGKAGEFHLHLGQWDLMKGVRDDTQRWRVR